MDSSLDSSVSHLLYIGDIDVPILSWSNCGEQSFGLGIGFVAAGRSWRDGCAAMAGRCWGKPSVREIGPPARSSATRPRSTGGVVLWSHVLTGARQTASWAFWTRVYPYVTTTLPLTDWKVTEGVRQQSFTVCWIFKLFRSKFNPFRSWVGVSHKISFAFKWREVMLLIRSCGAISFV